MIVTIALSTLFSKKMPYQTLVTVTFAETEQEHARAERERSEKERERARADKLQAENEELRAQLEAAKKDQR